MSTLSNAAAAPRVPVLADAFANSVVRNIALVLGGTAFMILMAQIAIPVPPSPVPITGQTLGVILIGASLGSRRGIASISLYVLLGLFFPVYADGNEGLNFFLHGGNAGYLVGFIVATGVAGWFAEHGSDRKVLTAFLSFIAVQLIVFGFGVPVLKATFDMTWSDAIHNGFTLFIIGGLIKAAIGAILMPTAWKLQKHSFKRS